MKRLARQLRKRSTDAERLLWYYLRAHRMGGYKFRRQVVIEPYIADFVCYEAKLIIEADGGQHVARQSVDRLRSAFLEQRGYRLLRFWNHDILNDTQTVLAQIHHALTDYPAPVRKR